MGILSDPSNIFERLDQLEATICEACVRSGRRREEVELVAASKKQTVEVLRVAWDAGVGVFGENRVQEAREKIPLMPSGVRWHLIGHLQRNKVRMALPLFDMVHGVDSVELAHAMDRVAAELGLFPKVLLQVNVSGEGTKFGFEREELKRELDGLLSLGRVEVHGLMTMAPYAEDAEEARPYFVALRELREELEVRGGVKLPHLSMGMSGDYVVAIEEGATLIRIGTALFGARG